MKALAVCALLALLPVAAAQGSDPTARPDQRVQMDFQHYYTLDELEASLAALAAAYPEYLRLESVGRSVLGNELWVLSVTRLADGDPGQKPGLLLVAGLGEQDLWGTELCLFTVLELVQNHRRDPRVATLLERAAIYVVPSAHPDLRAALFGTDGSRSGLEARASVDGNFEIGWRPGAPGAGPYPLSEPETHGLARFLLEHENIAAVQVYGAQSRPGQPAALPELDSVDRAVHTRLAARGRAGEGPLLVGLPELGLPGGTLLEFAHWHRGAFGFQTLVAGMGNEATPEVDELFGLGRRALGATLVLAEGLPRLALSSRRPVVRLGRELWQIDLTAANVGLLPTVSRLGSRRFAAGPPRLELSGAAELVAAAVGDAHGQVYEVVATRGQRLSLGELEGGSASDLRLVVLGAENASVVIELRAPRAGPARLELSLQ